MLADAFEGLTSASAVSVANSSTRIRSDSIGAVAGTPAWLTSTPLLFVKVNSAELAGTPVPPVAVTSV